MELPHLEIENLHVGFTAHESYRRVLDVAHLHVDRGEAFGLVGESGCGKSVLALTLLRLLRCPPGQISASRLRFDGRDILSLSEREMRHLRGRELSMIFQDPMSSMNPVFTVGSQLTKVIRRIHGERGKQARARAAEFVRLVGLPDPENTLTKYPHQLSGGERQRVIIALALCCDAKFIIADEPTRNLDVTVQAGILKTIARLRHELGVSLLFIANNLGLVSAMCDRVGILLEGRIVETGTVDEVIGDPRHPYTHMLLRAIPTTEEQGDAASALAAAVVPALPLAVSSADAACPYYDRCPEREAYCESDGLPELVGIGGSHEVACRVAMVTRGEA